MALSIDECYLIDKKLPFDANDQAFLLYEIDWIIVGQGLRDIEEYLSADRSGRGRALGAQQRRYVWHIYETFIKNLRNQGKCMFSEWLHVAQQKVSPQYDYVFIDEAQDLKPVAIRFCIGLCRDPAHIFLTADSNQSIYGNGLSWSRVSTELRFNGKTRIFRRNYRTTKEIWNAIKQIAPNTADIDRETMEVETVYNGPYPIYARYTSLNNQSKKLNEYLHEALRLERVTPRCAVVLCQTEKEMDFVMPLIDKHLNPKKMRSNEVDMAHPGVKIMTMHAVKGLQFPIVAVFGVEAGRMPLPVPQGIDESEHNNRQQRLLFVACSRAMRRLMVLGKASNPSPFMSKVTDEYWQIEDL